MKYIINVEECNEPNAVRYWATVQGLDGCFLAEETIEQLMQNAPGVIQVFIEVSNDRGANIPVPTGFEFRIFVPAQSAATAPSIAPLK